MKLGGSIFTALMVLTGLFLAFYFLARHPGGERPGLATASAWERMANPGALSQAHAFLAHNCNACHTPVKGIEPASCILCHANNETVLQRQPSAFHASVGACVECHREHRGAAARVSEMDHAALARLGLRQLERATEPDDEGRLTASQIRYWLVQSGSSRPGPLANPRLSAQAMTLDCATCHQNDDHHFGLFGSDCSACHEAARWTLPEFRHPSASSLDCAQCHQAPPSHYMGHFNMISATVAGQPHARVDQCFLCHQTTSWNDIKKVGWYKHH